MGQMTFTDAEYANRKRVSRREQFLDTMDKLLPWNDWVAMIEPYYYHNRVGRPPIGAGTMLRMYLLQCWFNLPDEGLEEAIYDSYAFSRFMGVNFLDGQAPDATTLCKFRHLLEENHIGEKIFADVVERLERAGLMSHGGTIVDATIIAAPSSTKNKEGKRDPEMHQAKKGNQWHFGMKEHIGVDPVSGLVHSVVATAANVHDVTVAHELVREGDGVVYGDSGYLGLDKRDEMRRFDGIEYKINRKPSSIKASFKDESCTVGEKKEENCEPPAGNDSVKDGRSPAKKKKNKKGKRPSGKDESCGSAKKDERRRKASASDYAVKVRLFSVAEKDEERRKSSVRCKVEHIFLIVKRDFGYAKARYRGLAKNAERFYMLFALANILKCVRAGRADEFCRA